MMKHGNDPTQPHLAGTTVWSISIFPVRKMLDRWAIVSTRPRGPAGPDQSGWSDAACECDGRGPTPAEICWPRRFDEPGTDKVGGLVGWGGGGEKQ